MNKVKLMIVVNKLGITLIKIGIIKLEYQIGNPLFNLEAGSKKAFGLFHCKEYVERCETKGFL